MSHKYPLIAAAVAAAMASGYAFAAPPTLAQAASPAVDLVLSGSSAAESSVANAIQNDLCGGSANTLTVESTGNKNFYSFSCFTTPTTITGVPAGTLATVYYRTEGGSVTGALPIATGVQIKRLNLSDTSCSTAGTSGSCAVTGTTSINGPNDSWTGAVVEDTVQLGVTDIEPGKLIGADYPSNYATSTFGSATPTQMANLPHVPAVQQVFGIAVNTSGLSLATAGQVNLTKEAVANIYTFGYTDWSLIPDALTGSPISSAPAAITHVDREPGSGTRTSANIYFLNYPCAGTTAIQNSSSTETLNYATGDELTLANSTPGAIAYASIDNLLPPKNTAYTNLVLATINGVTPSTLAAATGQYDYWFEATLVPNSSVTGTSADLSTWLQGDLPKLSAAPIAADINVIPNVAGNTASIPLSASTQHRTSGTTTIYINPYSRSGNSCSIPAEKNGA